MELTDLRHFHHVAASGSFARGARLSHVSPPAISKAIRKLEDELGTKLFERTTRRVQLTPAGELLRARCERIFAEVAALRAEVAHPGESIGGTLRIAAMEVLSIDLLPRALARLMEGHAALAPRAFEMIPSRMEECLREGSIDVGLTIGGGARAGIDAVDLGESAGVLVCGKKHPLHRNARVRAADVREHPSVVPSFLGHEHLPPLDQFPDARWPRRVGATIELLQMGVRLVEEGTLLGYFPEISVRAQLADGRLRALKGLPAREAFALRALVRSGERPRPAVRELIALLRALVRDAIKPSGRRASRSRA
jgi:DNA-binding transcriptional LysR family regulator